LTSDHLSYDLDVLPRAAKLVQSILRQDYHNKTAGFSVGGREVRWYVVTGKGSKTNVTGHRWKDGKDTDKGTRVGGGLAAEKTAGNVFNYHVNFNS
jgi:hypothetical protein